MTITTRVLNIVSIAFLLVIPSSSIAHDAVVNVTDEVKSFRDVNRPPGAISGSGTKEDPWITPIDVYEEWKNGR